MLRKGFIGLLIMLGSCNSQAPSKKENVADLKWSVRMANSIMTRSDSLIHHLGVKNQSGLMM